MEKDGLFRQGTATQQVGSGVSFFQCIWTDIMDTVGYVGDPEGSTEFYQILLKGDCEVACWWPDATAEAEDGSRLVDLEELADLSVIFVDTGIAECRQLARRIGDVITGRHIIVHTIRGIEANTINTASKILYEETPTRRIGFVTGPLRLDDIQEGRPASAVCASNFPEVHDLVEEAMMSSRLRIYHARDLMGAELSAVYSRLIALMSGMGRALGLGTSLQGTLFVRGLAEMSRFVGAHDGDERTPFGLSGAGNLYADTAIDGNIDFEMGIHLAAHAEEGEEELIKSFGTPAREILDILAAFEEANEKAELDLYLLDASAALITAGLPASQVVKGLMSLPALEE